eukprot:CAMPEP_0172309038 /NCGR_PEP_ID=MMETSP1058-20130122/9454_1 /TAXON_ID=83371 /ORGANISM="Detonula confervacea, Strain CCMP 353" /LENGTH=649 /DNA_ID=CAMNT_0013021589 /DNA_START=208 /DNA_END=2154 /DNA_ORIENTATION=-
MSPHPSPPLRAMERRFSSGAGPTESKSSALVMKGTIAGIFLFLLSISDPVISALETSVEDDENNSYWMDQHLSQKNSDGGARDGNQSSRLRNANKHFNTRGNNQLSTEDADDDNIHNLPNYSRIVIVGGGMAGLHTALALAERMSNPSIQNVHPPTIRKAHNKQIIKNRNAKEIIVLDASRIGNGASGRAKGLVVPGFQVPLENLQENALDADDDGAGGWTVPALVTSLSNMLGLNESLQETPQYTKAVVEQMYDLTYVAMDRLRTIVKMYGIDCDWVDSGAVEGSIHPEEDGDDEDDAEDDGCQMLTSIQVDEIMGRPSSSGSKSNLYKWGEYDPSCAGVNPLALTIGLANAVEQWGVQIYEYTKVMELEKRTISSPPQQQSEHQPSTQGKYTIVTDQGHTLHCDHIVLCTGAESLSNNISQRLSRSFTPVWTWMAATEPLRERCPLKSGVADSVLLESSYEKNNDPIKQEQRPAPMCGDDHISLNYWRNNNKDDGRLLFGSLADTYSLPKWLISWRLRNALTEIYPQLENVQFSHVWGGKLAFALNSMPLIGRDMDYDDSQDNGKADDVDNNTSFTTEGGVWYATGFAGHGIVPTALAGSLLANAILGIPNQQQWQLFQTYFPPSSWNGYPCSRMGAGMVLLVYNTW